MKQYFSRILILYAILYLSFAQQTLSTKGKKDESFLQLTEDSLNDASEISNDIRQCLSDDAAAKSSMDCLRQSHASAEQEQPVNEHQHAKGSTTRANRMRNLVRRAFRFDRRDSGTPTVISPILAPPPVWNDLDKGERTHWLTEFVYDNFKSIAKFDFTSLTSDPPVYFKGGRQPVIRKGSSMKPIRTTFRSAAYTGVQFHFGRAIVSSEYVPLDCEPTGNNECGYNFYLHFPGRLRYMDLNIHDIIKSAQGRNYWSQWNIVFLPNTGSLHVTFKNQTLMRIANLKDVLMQLVAVKNPPSPDVQFFNLPAEYLTGPCKKCKMFESVGGIVSLARQYLAAYHPDAKVDWNADSEAVKAKCASMKKWNPKLQPIYSPDMFIAAMSWGFDASRAPNEGDLLVTNSKKNLWFVPFKFDDNTFSKMSPNFKKSNFFLNPGGFSAKEAVWRLM